MKTTEPTGRIDTTITQVAVQRGDSTTATAAAALYVRRNFAEESPKVLAVWSAKTRDNHGNPVFNVEWETAEEQTS